MDKPFSSWVQWDNTVCNPLAPAREQTQSAWQHGYESGFVDGMSKQAQSSVDKAVNAMCHKWQGLTDDEIDRVTDQQWATNNNKPIYAAHKAYARAIEAKLKEKNNAR